MITINKGQCISCLKCVSVCPFTVLGTAEGKPYLREDKACLKCMHCAAACPQNAISYGDQDAVLPQQVQPLPENFSELLERHILTRRSYRHFKNEPVDRDLIGHALELASWGSQR